MSMSIFDRLLNEEVSDLASLKHSNTLTLTIFTLGLEDLARDYENWRNAHRDLSGNIEGTS